jgi:hypothetical protein
MNMSLLRVETGCASVGILHADKRYHLFLPRNSSTNPPDLFQNLSFANASLAGIYQSVILKMLSKPL